MTSLTYHNYTLAMGVNVSKKHEHGVKGENVIESIVGNEKRCSLLGSFSDNSIFCGSSSDSDDPVAVSQSACKYKAKTPDTGQLEIEDVTTSESDISYENQVQNVPNREETNKFDTSRPVSDAEKRLRMYGNEIKATNSDSSQQQSTSKGNADTSAGGYSVLRKTRPHLFLRNDEILKVRRVGVFANDPFPNLNPVSAKRAGQSDILYQLGQEGIVKPMSAEERTIGELRSAGILNPSSDENMPRTTYPRLAPLKVESVWAKVPEHKLAAPWDKKDCLQTETGYVPSASELAGQEAKRNKSTMIKLKMLNMDLL